MELSGLLSLKHKNRRGGTRKESGEKDRGSKRDPSPSPRRYGLSESLSGKKARSLMKKHKEKDSKESSGSPVNTPGMPTRSNSEDVVTSSSHSSPAPSPVQRRISWGALGGIVPDFGAKNDRKQRLSVPTALDLRGIGLSASEEESKEKVMSDQETTSTRESLAMSLQSPRGTVHSVVIKEESEEDCIREAEEGTASTEVDADANLFRVTGVDAEINFKINSESKLEANEIDAGNEFNVKTLDLRSSRRRSRVRNKERSLSRSTSRNRNPKSESRPLSARRNGTPRERESEEGSQNTPRGAEKGSQQDKEEKDTRENIDQYSVQESNTDQTEKADTEVGAEDNKTVMGIEITLIDEADEPTIVTLIEAEATSAVDTDTANEVERNTEENASAHVEAEDSDVPKPEAASAAPAMLEVLEPLEAPETPKSPETPATSSELQSTAEIPITPQVPVTPASSETSETPETETPASSATRTTLTTDTPPDTPMTPKGSGTSDTEQSFNTPPPSPKTSVTSTSTALSQPLLALPVGISLSQSQTLPRTPLSSPTSRVVRIMPHTRPGVLSRKSSSMKFRKNKIASSKALSSAGSSGSDSFLSASDSSLALQDGELVFESLVLLESISDMLPGVMTIKRKRELIERIEKEAGPMAWEQMLKGFFCKGDINRDRTLAHVEDLSRDVMVVLNIGKNLTERFFRNFFQLTGQDPSPPILICCDDIEEWNDSLEALSCLREADSSNERLYFVLMHEEKEQSADRQALLLHETLSGLEMLRTFGFSEHSVLVHAPSLLPEDQIPALPDEYPEVKYKTYSQISEDFSQIILWTQGLENSYNSRPADKKTRLCRHFLHSYLLWIGSVFDPDIKAKLAATGLLVVHCSTLQSVSNWVNKNKFQKRNGRLRIVLDCSTPTTPLDMIHTIRSVYKLSFPILVYSPKKLVFEAFSYLHVNFTCEFQEVMRFSNPFIRLPWAPDLSTGKVYEPPLKKDSGEKEPVGKKEKEKDGTKKEEEKKDADGQGWVGQLSIGDVATRDLFPGYGKKGKALSKLPVLGINIGDKLKWKSTVPTSSSPNWTSSQNFDGNNLEKQFTDYSWTKLDKDLTVECGSDTVITISVKSEKTEFLATIPIAPLLPWTNKYTPTLLHTTCLKKAGSKKEKIKGLIATTLTFKNPEQELEGQHFGKPFVESLRRSQILGKPHLTEDIIDQIYMREGLFRVPGDGDYIQVLKSKMDKEEEVDLQKFDVFSLAATLKLYLVSMPEPLITDSGYTTLANIDFSELKDEEALTFVKELILSLPEPNFELLSAICMVFHGLMVNEDFTRMDARSCAISTAPTILLPSKVREDPNEFFRATKDTSVIMEFIVSNAVKIFEWPEDYTNRYTEMTYIATK